MPVARRVLFLADLQVLLDKIKDTYSSLSLACRFIFGRSFFLIILKHGSGGAVLRVEQVSPCANRHTN